MPPTSEPMTSRSFTLQQPPPQTRNSLTKWQERALMLHAFKVTWALLVLFLLLLSAAMLGACSQMPPISPTLPPLPQTIKQPPKPYPKPPLGNTP